MRDPFGPSVRGNDAKAEKRMLSTRKNTANEEKTALEIVQQSKLGASAAITPSIADESGKIKDILESAA